MPDIGQLILREDGVHRTLGLAEATVYALPRVDKKLVINLPRFLNPTFMYSVARASGDTTAILTASARLGNYVSHWLLFLSLLKYSPLPYHAMTFVTRIGRCLPYDEGMERLEALRRVLFLKSLSEEERRNIAGAGYERRLGLCEALFVEGEPSRGLIVILEGSVKIYRADARGRELLLGIARHGASIGDLALFDGGNYPTCAEACEEHTRVFVVPKDRFTALMERYPGIAQGAVRALAIENRRLIEMLKAQVLHTVRSRLATYLLHAAGDAEAFSLHETNAVIGSHVGTVREVISRSLHALEDEGAIRIQGRVVTLLDREGLGRIATERD